MSLKDQINDTKPEFWGGPMAHASCLARAYGSAKRALSELEFFGWFDVTTDDSGVVKERGRFIGMVSARMLVQNYRGEVRAELKEMAK